MTKLMPMAQTLPGLNASDKSFLCGHVCFCQRHPNLGANGMLLKQQCVSARLKNIDMRGSYQSRYKAEVTYDMVMVPPSPFMDSTVPTKPRTFTPNWHLSPKLWPPNNPAGRPAYSPGQGMTRRPDIVIVKDVTKPPVQSNIEQVVEIKFPGDRYGLQQLEDYIVIAGHDTKMVSLTVEACRANPAMSAIQVRRVSQQPQLTADILALIYNVLKR